jgi:hypothetical protein
MQYETEKNLVMSTVHISEQDDKRLKNREECPLVVYNYEYGYIIYVDLNEKSDFDETIQQCENHGFSTGFIDLMKLARTNECAYLKLDCDGPEYKHLTRYEWQ